MAIGNKLYSLFDSPKQLQEFQRNLTGNKYLRCSLSSLFILDESPHGCILSGKICTRASAEPIHELKNTLISTDVFKIFG